MYFRNLWPLNAEAAEPEAPPPTETPPAEESVPDLVDPQDELKEFCRKKRYISNLLNTLQQCSERVNSREKTSETCEQELFDYVYALDHCVAKRLFDRLA